MNSQDMNRLNGLLAKLSVASEKAAREDGSFRKYHAQSIEALRAMRIHLKHLEHGLRTAKMLQPQPTEAPELFEMSTRATIEA